MTSENKKKLLHFCFSYKLEIFTFGKFVQVNTFLLHQKLLLDFYSAKESTDLDP